MANTVKVFFEAKAGASSSGLGEVLKVGSLYDPVSITLSSDTYARNRVDVPSETLTAVASPSGYRSFYIPSVDGYFLWYGSTEADNSCIKARANQPFWLPAQTTNYNADFTVRIAASPTNITTVYFYHDSGSTGYVDSLVVR